MRQFFTILTAAALALPSSAAEQPPCTLDIASQEAFDTQWKAVDANKDGGDNQFIYGGGFAWYTQNKSKAADDWIISPAVSLSAGKTYKIVAKVRNMSTISIDKQDFSVMVGLEQSVEGMTETVFSFTGLTKSSSPVDKDGNFTPAVSGDFYLGLHLTSKSYQGDFGFYSFTVTEETTTPGAVGNVVITAAPLGELKANLSWTWPSVTDLGGSLESVGGAYVYRGAYKSFTMGEESRIATVTDNASPGAQGAFTDTSIPEAGKYYYKIVPFNDNGVSAVTPQLYESEWIGAAKSISNVNNVTAIASPDDEKSVSVTWDAPTSSDGGYLDLSLVKYNISRSENGGTPVVIEEAWDGGQPYVDSSIPGLGSYVYTIKTVYNGTIGFSGVSSKAVVTGGTVSLPYTNDFATANSTGLFTMFHAEGTTRDWSYNSSKKALGFWGNSPVDAFAAIPVMELQAGRTYSIEFSTWVSKSSSPKDLSVCIGKEATVEAMDTEIFRETVSNAFAAEKSASFSVPATGKYRLAFRIDGESDYNDIFVNALTVSESTTSPLPVTGAKAEAAPAGELKAVITWTNPDKTTAGTPMTIIDRLEISRGDEAVATLSVLEAGTEGRYEDIVPEPGAYSYKITAFTGETASEPVTVSSSWIGYDTPKAPESVTAAIDGEVRTVTFDAVTEGIHGGYIDIESLRYIVSRNDDVLTTELATDTYTDDEAGLPLAIYRYYVKAVNGDFTGEAAESNALTLGDALELPYSPDFSSAEPFALWTFANAEGTANGWKYDEANQCLVASFASDDAWAFTPPIVMQKGECEVSIKTTCYSYRYPEDLQICLCRTTDVPLAESAVRITEIHVKSADFPDVQNFTFNVPESGRYYVGFGLADNNWRCRLFQSDIRQVSVDDTNVGIESVYDLDGIAYLRSCQSIRVPGNGRIEIFGISGSTVFAADAEAGLISLESIATGTYIAVFTAADGRRSTLRFIR